MALAQYAERYPVGQRQIKMLDETLDSLTAGLSDPGMFKYVQSHNPDLTWADFQLRAEIAARSRLPTRRTQVDSARFNRATHCSYPRFLVFVFTENLK